MQLLGMDVSNKMIAFQKGDAVMGNEWPPLKFPLKRGNKAQVQWYGELAGGKGFEDSVRQEIESE